MGFVCDQCERPVLTPFLYERPHEHAPTVTWMFCSPACRDAWLHEVERPARDEDDD